jgi:cell division septation protein DedD
MRRSALIALACVLVTVAGCSREKIDWKSAEAADTVEGYDHFVERHPDSALVTQARTRVAQLNEDRDWKKATAADTADAYRQFLAQHESGKWGEEARIRIENFSLDGTAGGLAKPATTAAPAVANAPATAAASVHDSKEKQAAASALPSSPSAESTTRAAAGPAKPAPAPAVKPPPPAAASAKPASSRHLAAATPVAAAPVAAKPAAAAAPTPSNPFGIQLGAFRSQDAALQNWKQLQAKYDSDLHGLFAHAVPVKQGADPLFRLQAPVGEESRARAICASLAKQSQPCVIVLPAP